MEAEQLASYRRCVTRICEQWPAFCQAREERLAQQRRYGHAAEKVAENILEDLFIEVLDWKRADLNNQVRYADLLLSRLGIKYLLLEAKRPGALAWNRKAVEVALDQACRYADEQRVRTVAVSDGIMLYAADRVHGGLRDRAYADLSNTEPPETLWWLSVHGIYRPRTESDDAQLRLLPDTPATEIAEELEPIEQLLHPKYRLPARCFAYVGHEHDTARLPKAIQAIISNYRGVKVKSVPEAAIPDVLERLAAAATELGKMPPLNPNPARSYVQLAAVMEQLAASGSSGKRD